MTDWLEQAKREIAEETASFFYDAAAASRMYGALIRERARNLELQHALQNYVDECPCGPGFSIRGEKCDCCQEAKPLLGRTEP